MIKTDYQFNLHLLRERARKKGNLPGLESIDRWIERSHGWEREAIHRLIRGLQSLIERTQREPQLIEDALIDALTVVEYYEAIKETEALHQEVIQRLSIWERFEIEIKRAAARRDALVMLSLQRDLDREIKRADEFAQRWKKDAPEPLDWENPAVLRRVITDHFSIEEIRTLCFDLEITHENLASDTRETLARELVDFCKRHVQLKELAKKVKELRPDI